MGIPPLEQMPHLARSLGKAGMDRLRYARDGTGRHQPRALNIENTVIDAMQYEDPKNISQPVADVLYGVTQATGTGRKPLSVKRLFNMFQCMPVINSREIQLMMNLCPRQARRYMLAARIALPFLVRSVKGRSTRSLADADPPS